MSVVNNPSFKVCQLQDLQFQFHVKMIDETFIFCLCKIAFGLNCLLQASRSPSCMGCAVLGLPPDMCSRNMQTMMCPESRPLR